MITPKTNIYKIEVYYNFHETEENQNLKSKTDQLHTYNVSIKSENILLLIYKYFNIHCGVKNTLDEYYISNNFRYTHIYVCFICIFLEYGHVWKILGNLHHKILKGYLQQWDFRQFSFAWLHFSVSSKSEIAFCVIENSLNNAI